MPDFRNHHRREADRLRSLAATATTEAIKARLLEEAENHERVAQIAEDLELVEQEAVQS
jgi:hypothetical protein